MTKWEKVKIDVLLKCKRHCCMCQKFCGTDIEVHHIRPRAEGGDDTFENAIPLCYLCHSAVGQYNPNHPKGNRYKPEELKMIRDNFYVLVENLVYKSDDIPESDRRLLLELKRDYTEILEYCIRTDFSAQLVKCELAEEIYNYEELKWSLKINKFTTVALENIKNDLLESLRQLLGYLSPEYFRLHESGMLIFKNQSAEEGRKLREELRPGTEKIRIRLKKIFDSMYTY